MIHTHDNDVRQIEYNNNNKLIYSYKDDILFSFVQTHTYMFVLLRMPGDTSKSFRNQNVKENKAVRQILFYRYCYVADWSLSE